MANYGSEGGDWCSKPVGIPHGVGIWKHIQRGWDTFSKYISYEVFYGTNVRVWQDCGCGSNLLKMLFLDCILMLRIRICCSRLYELECRSYSMGYYLSQGFTGLGARYIGRVSYIALFY